MVWLNDYLLFLCKVATFFIGLILVLLATKDKDSGEASPKLKLKHYNRQLKKTKLFLTEAMADKAEKKAAKKQPVKKRRKNKQPRIFVLEFNGDVKANQAVQLASEITAILNIANPKKDHVLIRLESPGGCVHGYGYAASQLSRLKANKIPLTVAIDRVAASGGYMMACIADTIIAAPFAVVGSIGVVLQLPNVHRLLKRHAIDFELITAGDDKRNLTVFGHNTTAAREKAQDQINVTHQLFKDFVAQNRPSIDIDAVATGQFWHATNALQLNLVDEISTSDAWLLDRLDSHQIYLLRSHRKKSLMQKIGLQMRSGLAHVVDKFLHHPSLPMS